MFLGVYLSLLGSTVCWHITDCSSESICVFFFFLAMLWDFSLPPRDRTQTHGSENYTTMEFLITVSCDYFFCDISCNVFY